jgi:hypothetical protein
MDDLEAAVLCFEKDWSRKYATSNIVKISQKKLFQPGLTQENKIFQLAQDLKIICNTFFFVYYKNNEFYCIHDNTHTPRFRKIYLKEDSVVVENISKEQWATIPKKKDMETVKLPDLGMDKCMSCGKHILSSHY